VMSRTNRSLRGTQFCEFKQIRRPCEHGRGDKTKRKLSHAFRSVTDDATAPPQPINLRVKNCGRNNILENYVIVKGG